MPNSSPRSPALLLGWIVIAVLVAVAIPFVLTLDRTLHLMSVLSDQGIRPELGALHFRFLMWIVIATPFFFLLARFAALGFRVGTFERWIILGHWGVAAGVFQVNGWRLFGWNFAQRLEYFFPQTTAYWIAAAAAQIVPCIVLWGAILHLLVIESERSFTSGKTLETARLRGRRFWQLVFLLYPLAMIHLVSMDLNPGTWTQRIPDVDVGPLGWSFLGIHRGEGESLHTGLYQGVANLSASFWVLAVLAILLVGVSWFLRRRFRDLSWGPSTESQEPSPEPPSPASVLPWARRPRPRKKSGNSRAFGMQFIVLNVALLILFIVPVFILIGNLFNFYAIESTARFPSVFLSLIQSLGFHRLLGIPMQVALAAAFIGLVGWLLSRPRSSGTPEPTILDPSQPVVSKTTVFLFSVLAFGFFGWQRLAGLRLEETLPNSLSQLATWIPSGAILVPLALLGLDPRRKGWPLPIVVAAVSIAWMNLGFPMLVQLGGNGYLLKTLVNVPRVYETSGPQWPWTATVATLLLGATLLVIFPLWMLAVALWPRRSSPKTESS